MKRKLAIRARFFSQLRLGVLGSKGEGDFVLPWATISDFDTKQCMQGGKYLWMRRYDMRQRPSLSVQRKYAESTEEQNRELPAPREALLDILLV